MLDDADMRVTAACDSYAMRANNTLLRYVLPLDATALFSAVFRLLSYDSRYYYVVVSR